MDFCKFIEFFMDSIDSSNLFICSVEADENDNAKFSNSSSLSLIE